MERSQLQNTPFADVRWVWMNGRMVEFEKANVHVLTHALHYGSGLFEGIRCYETARGPAIFRLHEGEVSGVLQADYGFHLFQVVRRHPAQLAELDEVREEIRVQLRQRETDREMAALLAEARQRFPVRVFPHNFPFNYEGFYRNAKPHKAA